jgi:hypothetical protein
LLFYVSVPFATTNVFSNNYYIHAYHYRVIPKRVAEISQTHI